MEALFGATFGKIVCGITVVDGSGKKISLGAAYLRFVPMFLCSAVSLISCVMLFFLPEFAQVDDLIKLAPLQAKVSLSPLPTLLGLFFLADVVAAAFTARKRAIHDFMAQSFCLYKQNEAPARAAKNWLLGVFSVVFLIAGYTVIIGKFLPMDELMRQAISQRRAVRSDALSPAGVSGRFSGGEDCRVSGIIYDKTNPAAIIGGRSYHVGEAVCGGVISGVTDSKVTIQSGDSAAQVRVGGIIE